MHGGRERPIGRSRGPYPEPVIGARLLSVEDVPEPSNKRMKLTAHSYYRGRLRGAVAYPHC